MLTEAPAATGDRRTATESDITTTMLENQTTEDQPQPSWQQLNSRQRRVVGVLIEKAKTTPDAYPLTLNALRNGCNQKSNRSPQMNLSADDVEEVLEQLRDMGAVSEVQGGGRVSKYRHRMYDWLGVDKVELAVMAELLLRGEQTVGELRGRAARMEPIAGLDELRPILRSLVDKKLVMELTPAGRGQLITHGLYKDRELDDLNSRAQQMAADQAAPTPNPSPRAAAPSPSGVSALQGEVRLMREELDELRRQVEQIQQLMQ